jgi:hypothetical protein
MQRWCYRNNNGTQLRTLPSSKTTKVMLILKNHLVFVVVVDNTRQQLRNEGDIPFRRGLNQCFSGMLCANERVIIERMPIVMLE